MPFFEHSFHHHRFCKASSMGVNNLSVRKGVPNVYVPRRCSLAAACSQANIGLLVIDVSSFQYVESGSVYSAAKLMNRLLAEHKGAALVRLPCAHASL